MGYCMHMVDSDFRMTAEKAREAKKMFKEAYRKAPEKKKWDSPQDVPRSWVLFRNIINANTFSDLMREFRWEVEMDDDENVVGVSFGGEKLGDDDLFFQMMAPFVEAGSFIEMRGEDESMWRWNFDGTSCSQVDPDVSWEQEPGCPQCKDLEEALVRIGELCGITSKAWSDPQTVVQPTKKPDPSTGKNIQRGSTRSGKIGGA
ncbi:MAG: hypothetical protein GF334_12805 [Candidatus Altiarchaeales archaeon]|nr:hypothetical protein [Candidatus Altiarchaeales archaeon]